MHQSTTRKHLPKPFIRPSWPVLRNLWHIETTTFRKFMRIKAHSLSSLSDAHSENQHLRTQNAKCPSFAKRGLPSFPRDRGRNCRLTSSNSIGSECCLEFVIFSQPMVKVRIIHDWVTTFIVVHDRFTTNGYALPVPHIHDHKMDF